MELLKDFSKLTVEYNRDEHSIWISDETTLGCRYTGIRTKRDLLNAIKLYFKYYIF